MPNVANVSVGVNLDLSKSTGQLRAFTSKKYPLKLDDKFSGSMQSITASTKNFDQSLAKATNRVVAFGAAAAVFNAARRTFQAFASDTVEVEDALTRINVNLGESVDGLKKFSAELFQVARITGQSFEAASKAAEEFARQGISSEEVIKRTRDALILSRIAAIDSAEAVTDLTAAVNAYSKEALTTTDIINKFVALDTQFAVSSKDLADGLQRAGAVAVDAGLSLDKFLAIITSIKQETGRSGAVIGNSLKTIFERVKSPQTLQNFEELGIATKDLEGQLLPVDQILNNLASSFDHLSQAQQKQISKNVANIQQINVFKTLLKDLSSSYSVTARAAEISANAQDQAIQKNLALNKTLKTAINTTQLTITEFFSSLGNESIGPIFKTVLDGFEGLRKSLAGDDSIGQTLGQSIVKGVANVLTGPGAAVILFALAKTFSKVVSTIRGEFQSLVGLNTIASQRVKVQETINGLLAQANQQELKAFNTAGSTLARQEAILAIKMRIAAVDQSSSLVNSFLGPGTLGGGTSINKRLTGKVGNFADPLQSAIANEIAAGVPRNLIYIDRDPRLVGPSNPQGLLVANRRDEPAGGWQGVNRVIAQGGDPKSAGTVKIPHFAAPPFEVGQFRTSKGQFVPKDTVDSINALFASLNGLDRSRIKTVAVEIRELSKDFNQASKNLISGNILSQQSRARRGEGKVFLSGGTQGKTPQQLPDIPQGQFSGDDGYAEAFLRRSAGAVQYPRPIGPNIPLGFGNDSRKDSRRGYRRAQVEDYRDSGQRQKEIVAQNQRLESLREKLQFAANTKLQQKALTAENVKFEGLSNRLGKAGIFGSDKRDLANVKKLGFDPNNQRVSELLRDRSLNRQSRQQNAGLVAAIALPAAAGFVPEGKGGTAGGIISGAASGAAQFGSVGLLSGNPYIAGISALIGGLAGGFSKLNKSVEEFNVELNNTTTNARNAAEGAQRIAQLYGQIEDARQNGGDKKTLDRLNSQLFDEIKSTKDPEVRARFSQGFSGPKQATDYADEQAKRAAAVTAAGNISSTISSQGQENTLTKIGNLLSRGSSLEIPLLAPFGTNLAKPLGNIFKAYGEDSSKESNEKSDALASAIRSGLTKENAGSLDRNFLVSAQSDASPANIEKLVKMLGAVGNTAEITEKNFRSVAQAALNASLVFAKIQFDEDKRTKTAAFAPTNLGAFSKASFDTPDEALASFGANRGISSSYLPNNARKRDQSFLASLDRLDELGGFGAGGLKDREDNDPVKILKKQATARLDKSGFLDSFKSTFQTLQEARGINFNNARGESNEKALQQFATTLSKNKDPQKAVYGNAFLARQTEINANIKGLNAEIKPPNFIDYRGSEPGVRTSTLGGGSKLAAAQYFDAHKAGSIGQEQASIVTAIDSLNKALDKASDLVVGMTLQIDGSIKLVSDTLSPEARQQLATEMTAFLGKKVNADLQAVNRRASVLKGQIDNKPLPPTLGQSLIANTPFSAASAFGD